MEREALLKQANEELQAKLKFRERQLFLCISFWATLLLGKFLFQRPLSRILAELGANHNLKVSPGTVTDELKKIVPLFTPLYEAIVDRYSTYKVILKYQRTLLAFFWAHVRRDFLAVFKDRAGHEQWAIDTS